MAGKYALSNMTRRLIRTAQVSGDTAMPAAEDVAANIYRWERGTVTPSDRYRLYYCHTLGIPSDRFGDPRWDPADDVPRVIITISLPEGTNTQIKLTSTETSAGPDKTPEGRTPDGKPRQPAVHRRHMPVARLAAVVLFGSPGVLGCPAGIGGGAPVLSRVTGVPGGQFVEGTGDFLVHIGQRAGGISDPLAQDGGTLYVLGRVGGLLLHVACTLRG